MKKILFSLILLLSLTNCKDQEILEFATLGCLGGTYSQDTTTISRITCDSNVLVDFQHNKDKAIQVDFQEGDGYHDIALWTSSDTGFVYHITRRLHFEDGIPTEQYIYLTYKAFPGEKAMIRVHSVEK